MPPGSTCMEADGKQVVCWLHLMSVRYRSVASVARPPLPEVMALLLRVLRCCMWCLEKFLKFLNKRLVSDLLCLLRGSAFCCRCLWLPMLSKQISANRVLAATVGSRLFPQERT